MKKLFKGFAVAAVLSVSAGTALNVPATDKVDHDGPGLASAMRQHAQAQ